MTTNSKLNILFASPEAVPFASSGGLGEVAGSLPKSLNRMRSTNIECRVIMPLYEKVSEKFRKKMKFLGSTEVAITWRKQYMGVFELRQGGVTYYFIDNEFYFKRANLYGYYDDGERFVFFSKAIFEALEFVDFVPDIIHANDWQTAMVPVFQNSLYRRDFMKTVFTVHNIEYQGFYGTEFNEDVIGLSKEELYVLEYRDGLNLMKGGIESCNVFSTVSPSYSEELKTPEYSFGMDEIIRRNSEKLTGILNGIDTKVYDPAKDPMIEANYSSKDLSGKAVCKKNLQKLAGLPENDLPVVTLISRLVPPKGIDILKECLDWMIDTNNMQFIVLGSGFSEYEEYFKGLEKRHPNQVKAFIGFDIELSHKVYAGGDILLVPSRSEPCGLTQMIGCRYGNVPLVRKTGGLGDSITDCTLGDGSGFIFTRFSSEDFMNTLSGALIRYKDKTNWTKLVKHDLSLDFSWKSSAKQYSNMYHNLHEMK